MIEREIVAMQIRLNWRGRPVLQASRAICTPRYASDEHGKQLWTLNGYTQFRDVRRKDAIEAAEFLKERAA